MLRRWPELLLQYWIWQWRWSEQICMLLQHNCCRCWGCRVVLQRPQHRLRERHSRRQTITRRRWQWLWCRLLRLLSRWLAMRHLHANMRIHTTTVAARYELCTASSLSGTHGDRGAGSYGAHSSPVFPTSMGSRMLKKSWLKAVLCSRARLPPCGEEAARARALKSFDVISRMSTSTAAILAVACSSCALSNNTAVNELNVLSSILV